MIEKSIRGGICHAFHRYLRANNKYIKDQNENREFICMDNVTSFLYVALSRLKLYLNLIKSS